MNSAAAEPTAATSASTVQSSRAPTPFDQELVTLSKRESIELRQRASSYQALHARAVQRLARQEQELRAQRERWAVREAELLGDLQAALAQIRDLRQRVFGAKTEQSRSVNGAQPSLVGPRRPRGQQRGHRGHGRRREAALPTRVEEQTLQASCPRCGLELAAFAGTQDAEVLEVEVKAYRRVIRRHRYRPVCRCGCLPGIVVAPRPPQLLARGKLGVSIWVEVLLSKFLHGQPTHRLLQDWQQQGLHIAQGTLSGGLHALLPLFDPLEQAWLQQLRSASHWHADETRWEVFEEQQGKVGHRWYLWVFQSKSVAWYVLDPSRSALVPQAALHGVEQGILSVDRYAAYRKFSRLHPGVELAICWAHQRRDFLRVAGDHPILWDWAMGWVQRIGALYTLHARRRLQWSKGEPQWCDTDQQVRAWVQAMQQDWQSELQDPALGAPAHKVLRTMRQYWPGLTVFLAHPLLDLDNNAAERALRGAVVGRKNDYGSGSAWSGQLAATLLSLLNTVRLWRINPRTWLSSYLNACAAAGGQAPPDCSDFIPWQMDAAQQAAMRASPT